MADDDRTARLLADRAQALARPAAPERAPGSQLLVVEVGRQRVAVAVQDIREVVTPGHVTALPGAPTQLAGVRGLRGDVVCLADAAGLLARSPAHRPSEQHVVVLEDVAAVGLLVDAVLDLVHVDDRDVGRSPPASDPLVDRLVSGMLPDATLVLDARAVLSDPRLSLDPEPAPRPPEGHP